MHEGLAIQRGCLIAANEVSDLAETANAGPYAVLKEHPLPINPGERTEARIVSRRNISPAREQRLTVDLLRNRVGIDPDTLAPVVNLVALGLTNTAWRNTCVEDWHSE